VTLLIFEGGGGAGTERWGEGGGADWDRAFCLDDNPDTVDGVDVGAGVGTGWAVLESLLGDNFGGGGAGFRVDIDGDDGGLTAFCC
jgi:hypothetical protein